MGLDFWFNQSHYSGKKRISGEEELNVFKEEKNFDDFKEAAKVRAGFLPHCSMNYIILVLNCSRTIKIFNLKIFKNQKTFNGLKGEAGQR